MKLSLNSQLFKIETNDNFALKKIKKNKLIDKVLSNFKVSKNYKIFMVNKKSNTSKIFFIKDRKNTFVLRSSIPAESKYLKNQCMVISNLKKNFFFKFVSGKLGYLFKSNNQYFFMYYKVNGNIFNGQVNQLDNIFKNLINIHKTLNKKKIQGLKLQIKNYKINEIKKNGKLLINKEFINKIFLKNIISNKTKKLLKTNKIYIENCLQNLSKIKLNKKKLQIVHGDINHSNIIISKKKVNLIDLEDVIIDDFRVTLSSGIFKILRHVVFKNKNKLSYANSYYLNLRDNLLKKKIISYKNEIFDFCNLRTLSDISLIIKSFYNGEKKFLYDFEKKILNLIELRYIFKLNEFKS